MQANKEYPWTNDLLEHTIEKSQCGYDLESPYWFIHNNYICNIKRNFLHVWVGYIYIPQGHPCFGKFYDDINVNVHGSLTFSLPKTLNGINYYVLGFDTGHYDDIIPDGYVNDAWDNDNDNDNDNEVIKPTYKDYNFVKQETMNLADQLLDMENV